jgi:hypothetical protein
MPKKPVFGGYIHTGVRAETNLRAGKPCQYILQTQASRALSLFYTTGYQHIQIMIYINMTY